MREMKVKSKVKLVIPQTISIQELVEHCCLCDYYGWLNVRQNPELCKIYSAWRKQSLIIPSVKFCPFYSSFEIEKKKLTDRKISIPEFVERETNQLLKRGRQYCNLSDEQDAFIFKKPCETPFVSNDNAYPDNCKFARWFNRIVKDMKKSSTKRHLPKEDWKPYLSFYKKVSQTYFYDYLLTFITQFLYDYNPGENNKRIKWRIGKAIASKCLDTKACPYKSIANLIIKVDRRE